MEKQKVFYLLTELSERFQKNEAQLFEMMQNGSPEFQNAARLCDLRFQLAQAQQLSMISAHLADIASSLEALVNRKKEK